MSAHIHRMVAIDTKPNKKLYKQIQRKIGKSSRILMLGILQPETLQKKIRSQTLTSLKSVLLRKNYRLEYS